MKNSTPDFAKDLRDAEPQGTLTRTDVEIPNLHVPNQDDEEPTINSEPDPSLVDTQSVLLVKKGKRRARLVIAGVLGLTVLSGAGAMYLSQQTSSSVTSDSGTELRTPKSKSASSNKRSVAGGHSTDSSSASSTQKSYLKALWRQGAAAKHRGDIAGARRFWQKALAIDPKNEGFKASLEKLPRQTSDDEQPGRTGR